MVLHAKTIQKPGQRNASRLNQALMELGAMVCHPRNPDCLVCPIKGRCLARKQGLVNRFPCQKARPKMVKRWFAAFIVERNGRVLVRQRPRDGVNAGLWEFPNVELNDKPYCPIAVAGRCLGTVGFEVEKFCTIHHSITRYRNLLNVYVCRGYRCRPKGGERWENVQSLAVLALTAAHRKAADRYFYGTH